MSNLFTAFTFDLQCAGSLASRTQIASRTDQSKSFVFRHFGVIFLAQSFQYEFHARTNACSLVAALIRTNSRQAYMRSPFHYSVYCGGISSKFPTIEGISIPRLPIRIPKTISSPPRTQPLTDSVQSKL